MSYQNELTPQQLRNFRRRARFTVCGEPADVFAGPTDPEHTDYEVMFVTINRYIDTNAAWLEANGDEIRPDYMRECHKVDEADARRIISQELRRWAGYPAGTVSGWSPEDIAAEADRIARG